MLRHLTFPATRPPLLSNIDTRIGTALSILFFYRDLWGESKIRLFYVRPWNRIDYLDMYCGIILLSVMELILFLIVDYIKNTLCK